MTREIQGNNVNIPGKEKGWFWEKYVGNYFNGSKGRIIIFLIMDIHYDSTS